MGFAVQPTTPLAGQKKVSSFGAGVLSNNNGTGSFNAGVQKGTSSSFMGAPKAAPAPPMPLASAGPQKTQAGPMQMSAGPGAGPLGKPLGAPQAQQINLTAPKIPSVGSISVSAERNKDLDQQLKDQRDYTQSLKDNTSFASGVLSHNIADSAEGAKNAAKYMGGSGGAGMRQARMNQIDDSTTRANAGAQAQMLLGREQMVGNAINSQMNPMVAQQQGMLGQQGVGLQAEGLRQNYQNQLFGQGMAGQQLQLQGAQFNQNATNQAFGNQLAANNQTLDYMKYLNPYGDGGGSMGAPTSRSGGGGFGGGRRINSYL